MATHTLVNPIYWKSTNNSGPLFRGVALSLAAGGGENPTLKDAASQAYRIGDLVYVNTSGLLAIVTESTDTVDSPILGQAARAATGVTSASAYVLCWRPEDRFLMQVFHATPASAVTNQNQIGDVFPIIKDESGNDTYHIDLATTAESATVALARVQVVGFPEGEIINGVLSTVGDTYGWAIVKPLEFSIATDGDPLTRTLQY